MLPLKNSSRQAPPSLAADGSLQFSAKSGVKLRLLLQACDESGAALTSGGDKFEAAATCLADGSVSPGAAVVEDNADGTYDISVCLTRSGLHSLDCHFGGCSVSGFPVSVLVNGSSLANPGDFGSCFAVASDIHVSKKQTSHHVFTSPCLHQKSMMTLLLMPTSQLVHLSAGSYLNVRLLLQTPELIPILLSDSADGAKVHTLLHPRLCLRSNDGKPDIELQGQWQLGKTDGFSTCTFSPRKAGTYSAGLNFSVLQNIRSLMIFCFCSAFSFAQPSKLQRGPSYAAS